MRMRGETTLWHLSGSCAIFAIIGLLSAATGRSVSSLPECLSCSCSWCRRVVLQAASVGAAASAVVSDGGREPTRVRDLCAIGCPLAHHHLGHIEKRSEISAGMSVESYFGP